MKINILYFYSYSHLNTGSPMVLVNMIRSLDKEKYKPFFISSQKGPLIDRLKSSGVQILEQEAKSFSLRSPFKLLRSALKLARLLKSHHIRLLHINEYAWNLDLSLAAWFAGIPVITHVHNVGSIDKRNFVTHLTDKFLFVSENHKRHTGNIERVEKKASVVYNSIDSEYYGSGHNIRDVLGLCKDDLIVGTIAQIALHKGIDILCKTAQICCAENDRIKFIIVGPVATKEDDFAARMKEEIQTNNLQDKVKFIGPRNDIPDFLASIDVFFLPTRKETFGLVVGEALAAGVPVITSNVGGIPEIIQDNAIGYMSETEDPEAYAREILKEVTNLDERSDIKDRRKDHIRANFSDEVIYGELDKVYEELLGR